MTYQGEIHQHFEQVSGFTGKDERSILALSPSREVWGRRIEVTEKYSQTYLAIKVSGYPVLIIDSRENVDGSSSRSIVIGGINRQKDSIDYVVWSTENNGQQKPSGGQGFDQEIIEKGYPITNDENYLPQRIDVDRAVSYWLEVIQATIEKPETLDTVDFNISNLVGQFK